jgi:hypothetical protein
VLVSSSSNAERILFRYTIRNDLNPPVSLSNWSDIYNEIMNENLYQEYIPANGNLASWNVYMIQMNGSGGFSYLGHANGEWPVRHGGGTLNASSISVYQGILVRPK